MKLTRKEVADRAEKLLTAYLSGGKRRPRYIADWYAAAAWAVQANNSCEAPFTQVELAEIYGTGQGNVSRNADRIMAHLPDARRICGGF